MNEAACPDPNNSALTVLAEQVTREVWPEFRFSSSPSLSEELVKAGTQQLFRLLHHRLGDPELDSVGPDIIAGFDRWFNDCDLVKLVDRYEPFCKFLLRLIDPSKFNQLQADTDNRLTAAKVIKALELVNNETMKTFASCKWESFPLPRVQGQPNFLEHVARTYVFRNMDNHNAPLLSRREEAQVVQSFCVMLVWCAIKFDKEISCALTYARFSVYLAKTRDRFAAIAADSLPLVTEVRSTKEYRLLDALLPVPETPTIGALAVTASIPATNRVTVIEAEPGAGKTYTLKFLAWQQSSHMLAQPPRATHVPVYIDLKLPSSNRQSLQTAVQQELNPGRPDSLPPPWDSILLLLDGLNEVDPKTQTNLKAEIGDLLSKNQHLKLVVACRPNTFAGEFQAAIVVLRRLNDEQLLTFFRSQLHDSEGANELLTEFRARTSLSSWARIPLFTALIIDLYQTGGVETLANRAKVLRHCIRKFLKRETNQSPPQTDDDTKALLLGFLAFQTKSAAEPVFTKARALSILTTARTKFGATTLDIPKFLSETFNNHLLQDSDGESVQFAHEVYHDYLAACELETWDHIHPDLASEFILAHFAEPHWQECVRLYANLTGKCDQLIERGVEKNPPLAWLLLMEAPTQDPRLIELVAISAYSALECDIRLTSNPALAGASILVLADLGRPDLLEQALIRQYRILEPKGMWKQADQARQAEGMKVQEALVPMAYHILSVLRLGSLEQVAGEAGRFCKASLAAIRALKQIKAARALTVILASWTGKTFVPSSIIPAAILEAIIDLGVDDVLVNEREMLNQTLADWLALASEAGMQRAWPAYGRVLRLASRDYVVGIDYDPAKAMHWLRKAHESGISTGSLELALLLLDEPTLAAEPEEGQNLMNLLASKGNKQAIYEIADRLCAKCNPEDEAKGLDLLLTLANDGHYMASQRVSGYRDSWLVFEPEFRMELPPWAVPFKDRINATMKLNPSGNLM